MDRRLCALLSLVLLPLCEAHAVELHHIEVRKGTEGLASTPLTVANTGGAAIICNAALAHWYSTELAAIAPGAEVTIPLWLDPQTGTVSVLNDKQENMPVEALYCGIAGRAYQTRKVLVPDGATPAHAARRVACAEAGDRLECAP